MRDETSKFLHCVNQYKTVLENKIEGKVLFVVFSVKNKSAFVSLAPLSRAVHELGGKMSCAGYSSDRDAIDAVKDVWKAYKEKNSLELIQFLEKTREKCPTINDVFAPPEYQIESNTKGFTGDLQLPYLDFWYEEYREEDLGKTAALLWKEAYNIQPEERAGIGMELVPVESELGHPLQDYLDSFHIIWAMVEQCPGTVGVGGSSSTQTLSEHSERTSDLRATLLGCELTKEVTEEPFISFKKLSNKLNLHRIKPIDASFSIHGKGYGGKHVFGDAIGYPSPNGNTRWKSPGQFLYKLDFYPQTKDDDRDPQARVAFTETLPIDVFINSNLINWDELREKNQQVKNILDKCDKVFVKGEQVGKYVTDLEVGLIKPDGTRRWVRKSDCDVRNKINKEYEKRTGIRAGCMGNIPGGEAFTTPEYINGTFVGDVVVSLDQSYPLSKEAPFVVRCDGDSYEIIAGPKKEWEKLKEKKEEAWELLQQSKKSGTVPMDIISLKEKNFNRIGEFAINTNPAAKLCDYLIVNEKIAKMMHIALGSGYEPDRSTDYHIDIVFDAPGQELDVWGVDSEGKEHWILKKGEFVQ